VVPGNESHAECTNGSKRSMFGSGLTMPKFILIKPACLDVPERYRKSRGSSQPFTDEERPKACAAGQKSVYLVAILCIFPAFRENMCMACIHVLNFQPC